jgi:hypothetical protein
MKEGLTVSEQDQRRAQVLNGILDRQWTVEEASLLLGVSTRQVWRLVRAYRACGVAAVVHGNRGRPPVHRIASAVSSHVRELAVGRYAGVNQTHFTELLAEREGIVLSRSTVRRILTVAGLTSPRTRRGPQYRSRRERYPQEGMLLQIDASDHAWLQERGPRLTLVGAIDDATGTVPAAVFRREEDAHGYLLLLRDILTHRGVPLALYSDQHSIFRSNTGQRETVAEQLAGKQAPTQFGRALQQLGVQAIFARSPQAKGRVERLWDTFQDRLVSELRLAGATTEAEATVVLADFLPRFNARFGVPAAQPAVAYRAIPRDLDLDGLLAFQYERTVAADNTIRFFGEVLQLLPGVDRLSYARTRVTVQERLDGRLVVVHQGRILGTRTAPPEPVTLRARKATRPLVDASTRVPPEPATPSGSLGGRTRTPSADHPWRQPWRLTKSPTN